MPVRTLIEVGPPSPLRYLVGATVMMIGVVLPVAYMMFRNKRIPSTSYSKHMYGRLPFPLLNTSSLPTLLAQTNLDNDMLPFLVLLFQEKGFNIES
ncbi:hypothetical protein RIF29_36817 [Crotalaria pallida]|uniref:Uncharacterized protein n=1 Tax=Crotalaria pallida TaxID=3830 RepID=A0AAN9EBK1_CROPI